MRLFKLVQNLNSISINLRNISLPIIILVSVVSYGCIAKTGDSIEIREGEIYKFSHFISTIKEFPYEAPKNKSNKIINGFKKLTLKMNQKDVLELLGEPDGEQLSYNKTKGGIFVGSSWIYCLHRHNPEFASEDFDKTVVVYFNIKGDLYWAFPSGLEGLTPLGSPLNRTDTGSSVKS